MNEGLPVKDLRKFTKPLAAVAGTLIFFCAVHEALWPSYWWGTAKLLPHGKAEFYRNGIFYSDKYPLVRFRGQWYFESSGGSHFSAESGFLIVPFECYYNGSRTLEFEAGGKVYLFDRRNSTRKELRVVDGEWSYDAGEHWESIFDSDDL